MRFAETCFLANLVEIKTDIKQKTEKHFFRSMFSIYIPKENMFILYFITWDKNYDTNANFHEKCFFKSGRNPEIRKEKKIEVFFFTELTQVTCFC